MIIRLRSTASALLVSGLLVAACGGSADTAETAVSTDTADSTVASEVTSVATEPVDTAVVADEPVETAAPEPTTTLPEPGSGTIGGGGGAVWDGPDFVEVAGSRYEVLRNMVGQPATAEGVAPLFEYPADFPFPEGTVVGSFHVFDLDWRFPDDPVDEERIVGVDGVGGAEVFDSIAEGLTADESTRWARSSSQRDSINNDLFTALQLDGGEWKDRLILRSEFEPEPQDPPMSFNFEVDTDAIPEPEWLPALPMLEGGLLVEVREGYGLAEDFGAFGLDGYAAAHYFYPLDRFDELEAFFASGIIEAAGFNYEDTPFSNFAIRIDVSAGDWEGSVGVGSVNADGEDRGYLLQWRLFRDLNAEVLE